MHAEMNTAIHNWTTSISRYLAASSAAARSVEVPTIQAAERKLFEMNANYDIMADAVLAVTDSQSVASKFFKF